MTINAIYLTFCDKNQWLLRKLKKLQSAWRDTAKVACQRKINEHETYSASSGQRASATYTSRSQTDILLHRREHWTIAAKVISCIHFLVTDQSIRFRQLRVHTILKTSLALRCATEEPEPHVGAAGSSSKSISPTISTRQYYCHTY
jgi:hypothetical protein